MDVVLQVLATLALESGSLTSQEVLIRLGQGGWVVSSRDPSAHSLEQAGRGGTLQMAAASQVGV